MKRTDLCGLFLSTAKGASADMEVGAGVPKKTGEIP